MFSTSGARRDGQTFRWPLRVIARQAARLPSDGSRRQLPLAGRPQPRGLERFQSCWAENRMKEHRCFMRLNDAGTAFQAQRTETSYNLLTRCVSVQRIEGPQSSGSCWQPTVPREVSVGCASKPAGIVSGHKASVLLQSDFGPATTGTQLDPAIRPMASWAPRTVPMAIALPASLSPAKAPKSLSVRLAPDVENIARLRLPFQVNEIQHSFASMTACGCNPLLVFGGMDSGESPATVSPIIRIAAKPIGGPSAHSLR